MTKLKKVLKEKLPSLFKHAKALRLTGVNVLNSTLNSRYNKALSELSVFAPTDSGSPKVRYELTLESAKQVIPLLNKLAQSAKPGAVGLKMFKPEELADSEVKNELTNKLKELLNKYGSDKAIHNYHPVYAAMQEQPNAVTAVLEIGLGTNNIDVFSTMGKNGKPGASLRAFRDFFPNAKVFGADIDKRILFEENRIRTFWADQTKPETFDSLGQNIGEKLDLIIDDGLHAPNANLTVLLFALRWLKPGGWLVIEDITPESLPIWHLVATMLPEDLNQSFLVSANNGYLFCARRKN